MEGQNISEFNEDQNLDNEKTSENLDNEAGGKQTELENSNTSEKMDQPKKIKESPKLKSFRIEDETPRLTSEDGWLDILGSNDLKKKVIEPGLGIETRPQRGDWIVINMTGKLEDGTLIQKHDNLSIIVGDCDIVQGLDLTVALMEKGELAEVVVPPRLAYGEQGNLPEVPPNATIHYTVRLVDVKPDDDVDLNFEERIKIGDEKRERGNFWYSRGDFSTAVHCYRRALDFLDDENQNIQESSEEWKKLLNIRIKVYNNLAATQLKMDAFEAAIKSVNNVLMIDPKNVKALFRKGKILSSQGKLEEAIDILKQALQIEPETKIIHQELSKLCLRRKQEETQTKAMYKRMFKCDMQPQPRSKTKKRWISNWSIVIGGIFTVVCGIAVYKHLNSE